MPACLLFAVLPIPQLWKLPFLFDRTRTHSELLSTTGITNSLQKTLACPMSNVTRESDTRQVTCAFEIFRAGGFHSAAWNHQSFIQNAKTPCSVLSLEVVISLNARRIAVISQLTLDTSLCSVGGSIRHSTSICNSHSFPTDSKSILPSLFCVFFSNHQLSSFHPAQHPALHPIHPTSGSARMIDLLSSPSIESTHFNTPHNQLNGFGVLLYALVSSTLTRHKAIYVILYLDKQVPFF